MIYSGANDGMFHAYFMGKLDTTTVTSPEIVGLTDPSATGKRAAPSGGGSLGVEQWAYVPKNMLPYLRYLTDPNYCHLYYVNLPTTLVDAAIGDINALTITPANSENTVRTGPSSTAVGTWRTIAIGGMGLGGGCGCANGTTNCTKSVLDSSNNPIGLSSFFAFDVTDPFSPVLLWEFSDAAMGYAFTSPAVVRIGDNTHNGKWYVVIGSGPTGGMDTTAHQFLGRSNQSAKLFVIDLTNGTQATGSPIDLNVKLPGIGYDTSFVGAISKPLDLDVNQKDEMIYLSTVKNNGESNQWDNGEVLRVFTHESTSVNTWTVNRLLSADVGPVTSKVAGLTANSRTELWLYFGTGRYYFKTSTQNDDSAASGTTDQRKLFGLKDPCFSAATNKFTDPCSTTVTVGN